MSIDKLMNNQLISKNTYSTKRHRVRTEITTLDLSDYLKDKKDQKKDKSKLAEGIIQELVKQSRMVEL